MFIVITGVPGIVPNVTITNNTYGNMVTFILSWGEPFKNFNLIMKYRVSCSGDTPCPLSVDTTDNTTRSHIFNDFTTGSNYRFSVVAINSIGSGEAGVVMIGEVITTTTAPSVILINTTTLSEGMTTTTSSEGMTTTTSSVGMTTTMSSEIMTTIVPS